jgi:hypothetical protein
LRVLRYAFRFGSDRYLFVVDINEILNVISFDSIKR